MIINWTKFTFPRNSPVKHGPFTFNLSSSLLSQGLCSCPCSAPNSPSSPPLLSGSAPAASADKPVQDSLTRSFPPRSHSRGRKSKARVCEVILVAGVEPMGKLCPFSLTLVPVMPWTLGTCWLHRNSRSCPSNRSLSGGRHLRMQMASEEVRLEKEVYRAGGPGQLLRCEMLGWGLGRPQPWGCETHVVP